MKLAVLILLGVCCFHQTSGAIHSLKYFLTASHEVSNFPEFVTVGKVDEVQFYRYDSIRKRGAGLDWISKDPQYWEHETATSRDTEESFKNNVAVAMSRFNQTGGVHTVQNMYGCQWNDESGVTDGFDQWGYDGEDYVTLDLKNVQYIAVTPQALIAKHQLENDRARMEYDKNYFTQQCIEWLKDYLQDGSSILKRKVPPEASLLQKESGVICHATGFYPEGVMITWKRDGEEMLDDVDVGETLPNEDGTFQKRVVLTVSPEELENREYTCEVAHKSGETIILVESEIQRYNLESSVPLGAIIGVVVVLIVLIAIVLIAGFVLRKKEKGGFIRANTADSQSQFSNEKAR
ncbi:BOLA class I histocompatibility antigen, alpha chain BL3-7-like isoform X1 [Sardina pilchardus]|uniref:BOLA class I histocompatibility antigen, alpha chain BL3-7-like isoform X1 n=1 Tax=Sardina pilchardus TaxID=27697 RepID=UPI002E0F27D4